MGVNLSGPRSGRDLSGLIRHDKYQIYDKFGGNKLWTRLKY